MVEGEGEALVIGVGLGLTDGEGDGEAPAQVQSASSAQDGLTQRLVPPTVWHLKLVLQSESTLQVSKQAIGDGVGVGDGVGDGLGDGLGDGEAVTVKVNWQTFPVVVCCTVGTAGEALGRGLGSGVDAGLFIWKKSTTAVVNKMPVKPNKLHKSHFFSPGFFMIVSAIFNLLAPKQYS